MVSCYSVPGRGFQYLCISSSFSEQYSSTFIECFKSQWSEYSGMNRSWNQLKWICIREQLQININFVSLKVEGRRGEPQCQQSPSYVVRGVLYFSRAMEGCFSGAMAPAAACVKRRENDAFPCVVCHVCPLFIFLPLNWKGSGKSTFCWRIKRYRKTFSPGANLKSLLTDKPGTLDWICESVVRLNTD